MMRPYTITKNIWDNFYTAQMSGHMNMMGHPFVRYFFDDDAYDAAHNHFQDGGKNTDLVIE